MVDPIQILIAVVVTTLTVLLIVIGIELFTILKEFKKTLGRVNQILDDVETISNSISTPVEKFSGLIMGLQQGAGILRFLEKIVDKKKKPENE
jgi:hypothetical protein